MIEIMIRWWKLMDTNYQILRVFNNNAVLVKNLSNNREAVLVGKGIGFGKKQGQLQCIPSESIEKSFVTYDAKLKREYIELVEQLEESVLSMCAEVILMARKKLGELNNRVHIVLADHIGFALERIKAGMEIHNPFLDEIKMLYPEEFKVGLLAQAIIERATGIKIVEDEVGFIALHLNAARQKKDVKESIRNTRIIKELISIIEAELNCHFEKDLTYNRLIHHLRGTIERIMMGQTVSNPLLEALKKELKISYIIAQKLKDKIEDEFKLKVPDDELGFMAIHIDRLRRKNLKQ